MRFSLMITFGAMLMMVTACQGMDEGLDNNDNGMNNMDTQQTRYNDGNNRGNELFENNDGRTNRIDMIDVNEDRTQEDNDRNTIRNGENNYEVADRAAEKVANEINEVDDAYVLAGDNNAYVAVSLKGDNTDGEVDDRIKKQVADVVKSANDDIDNVYVSANPKFFDMMDNYAGDVRNGDPVEGFFEEFNDMIQRIFPNLER
ncbi:YhcN/YlaJ family sporulation lipoprotein [Filobacillus milosensis]|uniref:YhcN/YlaJ family sporulation lipoprotein n=1 Tax=Filobacillus milosensis TaxID=94137 RepID=A0A4Y8INM0_9BACI|nr:YhcN/YlaJ family sporulation lipoprotein [Filobacillus milosensis]TFB22137.1 YhcN/YlaJ family sporulation lipoprotein [Filobacillus milosensis]